MHLQTKGQRCDSKCETIGAHKQNHPNGIGALALYSYMRVCDIMCTLRDCDFDVACFACMHATFTCN